MEMKLNDEYLKQFYVNHPLNFKLGIFSILNEYLDFIALDP